MFDALLRRLEEEQKALALEALIRPQQRDAFEYGRVCGLYGGLEKARELMLAALGDEHERDKSL